MKNFIDTEKTKLKAMNFAEKRAYIWEYYKVHIFCLALGVFLFGSLLNAWVINPRQDEFLYIAWVGTPVNDHQIVGLMDSLNYLISPTSAGEIRITSYVLTGNAQIDMGLQTRLFAFLSAGVIDFFWGTREEIEGFGQEGFLRPIEDALMELYKLNPELYNEAVNRLLVISLLEREGYEYMSFPMAISMHGVSFFDGTDIPTEDLYLGMVINSQKTVEVAKALEVILNG